jgi:periplasmic protein TonB
MTTMTFESAYPSPRRAAVRRGYRAVSRVSAIAGQPVAVAAVARKRIAKDVHRSRSRAGLLALFGITAALHVAIFIAANRGVPAEHAPLPKAPPLALEIAPPKQEPPPPPPVVKPKPLPQVVKAVKPIVQPKPVPQPAPSDPIVRNDTPADTTPSPDAVRVAPAAAPAPAPAPAERVTEPRGYAGYLSNPAPVYPSAAQKRGLEGRVVLKVHVLANGRPDNIAIAKSSGHDILDEAAVKAVTSWVFEPARRGQTPIDGWVNVPLNFKLS